MKKLLFLLVMMLLPMMAMAQYVVHVIDGIYYHFNDYSMTAEVTRGYYSGSVVIPDKVEYEGKEYSVTSISEVAFNGCSDLLFITIPSSVTSIERFAFSGCSDLTSVYISDLEAWCKISFITSDSNPLYYAHHLFLNGEEIKDLVIPNSVTSIGSFAFYGSSGLTSVTIPNSVTSIGFRAFYGCSALTSITIPNSVTSIGSLAFESCSGLTSISVATGNTKYDSRENCNAIIETASNTLIAGCKNTTIPNSVTSIGDYAFFGCSGLTSITIPNSVTSIGKSSFSGCSGLTSITIGNSVTMIGDCAFMSCSGLTSITIPNSVTSIEYAAFQGCSGLTSITIPNSVTSIGNSSFSGCSGLISVTIGNGVTSIGNSTFSGCSGLTSVTIPNSVTTIGEGAFQNCIKIENVELSDELTIIKKQSFQNCSRLKTITIPSKVEFIYQEVFAGCYALENVKALPTTPPFLCTNSFSKYNIPLYVPEEAAATYQSTSPWNNFTSILTLSGDEPQTPKCATPTIKYIGGKLLFECETEGVEFVYSITTPANTTNQTGNNVDMPHTNIVSVYAKKEGYQNSDVATENIDVRGIQGDTNRDGVVTVADAVRVVNILLEKNE